MALLSPIYLQSGSYSAEMDRQLTDILFTGDGIVASGDFLVAQRAAGANMSVDVAAGRCVVQGDDITGQGKYILWSDATVNVPFSAAPGAGLSRYELIIAQVRDSDAIGGTNNDFIVTNVTGTAASSPTIPALPSSAIWLATVLVGSSVSTIVNANITDKRSLGIVATAGTLLARTQYNPGSLATYTPTSMGAVDNTNLSVSFTAPPSGDVIFAFEAEGDIASGAALGILVGTIWTTSVGELNSSYEENLLIAAISGSEVRGRVRYSILVTGLTPGTVYNWTPGAASINNVGHLYAGGGVGNPGAFLVTVTAA